MKLHSIVVSEFSFNKLIYGSFFRFSCKIVIQSGLTSNKHQGQVQPGASSIFSLTS
jgi:hypothetical protein